ncbi:unnamed protein product [Paramecium sonneborni]|uniref:Uncharacterized protein n=1 Tax=Paramecium sonneborni TaxID=65129 RepID=A0A8S1LT02_9CILI|nr:unnamed protein product [Paramecium sonneborni]
MNPNRPLFLGQNHRSSLLQPQEVHPRSYSVQIQSNRQNIGYSNQNDLKQSHLAQSYLDHQERLQQQMAAQNQILKQQLIEIENRQLKLQNELLSQQVQKIQIDLENTIKLISKKKKNPSIKQNLSHLSSSSQVSQRNQKQKSLSIASSDTKEIDQKLQEEKNKFEAIEFQISEAFDVQNHKQTNNGNMKKQKTQKRLRRKKKIKKYLIAVLACIRLQWKQRAKLKKQKQKILKEKLDIAKQKILAIPEENIRNLLLIWVKDLFDEIIQILNSKEFQTHCDKPNYDANQDENITYRQELIINLTQVFFDRLEQMTREKNLPTLIVDLMYLSLFHSQNPKVSLFVAKRTNFYAKNNIKISNQQEMLIISEYIFFRLIIQYMLKIFNSLKYKNETHEKLCKFFSTIIASFIQILYIDFFEDLKFVNQINVQLYQRKIVLNENLQAFMLEDDQIDEQEQLILGLHDRQQFEILFQQQMDWITQIGKKFYQILLNLHNQL